MMLSKHAVMSVERILFNCSYASCLQMTPGSFAPELDSSSAPSVVLQLPRGHRHKQPSGIHDSFFVWSSDDRVSKTCFVDLGVYTRNRAFRLLSSCKFGKTSRLRVATSFSTNTNTTSESNFGHAEEEEEDKERQGAAVGNTSCAKVNHFV
jgi:hypothetical protein